ncbi:helix-turn-helix domain-containing protein [Nostoc sp. WHI]|uniref:helix-turn-helix domain-containing protein n=1 Tax=Nostoc sp. WHI TaxID=2650611 RepID=UPI0018C626EE|nr:helix-turn-helix transcriptional regulator [Nostoc sp. WHI]
MKAEPERWKLHRDSYQSQVDELKSEISEYERLINCDISKPLKIQIDSLNKLLNALIKARLAAKISQQELADILGIDEERVQEYEDTDYQCASFVEILEVSTTLIATEAGLIESAASASIVIRFFQKLNKIPMAKNASLS